MRLHKPDGYFAFYFPHLHGLLFAELLRSTTASLTLPSPNATRQVTITHLCLLFGTLFLRGAACTWNDTLDAPYDRQVSRCRLRPIAREAVSRTAGLLFTLLQIALGVAFTLVPLPSSAWIPAALLAASQVVYPLFKRFTDYPQLWLGVSFGFGLAVGAGAGGVNVLALLARWVLGAVQRQWDGRALRGPEAVLVATGEYRAVVAVACLYAASVLNTLVYDTVYGHQDLADDLKAGVRSVAVAWRDKTKPNCAVLVSVEVGLLVGAGAALGCGLGFYILAGAGTWAVLMGLLWKVSLEKPESCMWCFRWMIWGTGIAIAGGLKWA